MSHEPIYQTGTDEMYNSFLVILKVRGDGVQLWSRNEMKTISKTHSFRVLCQSLDKSQQEGQGTDMMKVFVLKDSGGGGGVLPSSLLDKCQFKHQQPSGQTMEQSDLAIFMSSPMDSTRNASYALTLGLSKLNTSMEDLSGEDFRKIGSSYLYLDPKFSSQGIQRMQIISAHNSMPIGQMQVEYLIVTSPIAYGIPVEKPKWLSRVIQLDAGHRGSGSGCRADLPGSITENTVASFNYAARHGADMCELDVMCTADGVPVVYHNYKLDNSKPESRQIDELTLEELRDVKSISTHDKDCHHKQSGTAEQNHLVIMTNQQHMDDDVHQHSKPFPTLEEVLSQVDHSCALNIELKRPQLLPNGRSEAAHYREINDFVDRILNCIYEHSHGRAILLSTFNADIAIMLRLKQSQYPVLFLTTGDSARFHDPTTKTVQNAVHFAQAFDMAGINPNVAKLNEYLVRYAQDRGLLVYAWGDIKSAQTIKELKKTGLNGVIYDKIDLIKPYD